MLDSIVQRCMVKDPEERWQSVRDVITPLRWILAGSATAAPPAVRRPPARTVAGLAAGLLLAGVICGFVLADAVAPESQPLLRRWDVAIPSGGTLAAELFPSISVSPDGENVVFRAQTAGTSQLFVQGKDQFEARPIAGSEGAHTPFFSPDGRWIGFLANGRIYKVPVIGGTPSFVCEARSLSPGSPGAAWGAGDTIVFAAGAAGLVQVPAAGGAPTPLTAPNVERGEVTHIGPQFLPGGRELLFTVRTAEDGWRIAVMSLETRQWEWLPPIGDVAGATYVETGHLVYAQSGSLYAVPLDIRRRTFAGPPAPLFDDVYTRAVSDAMVAQFSVSNSGMLAYVSGHAPQWELVRVNAGGESKPITDLRRTFRYPRLAPNGSRVAVTVEDERTDIYSVDVDRGSLRRLTTTGSNTLPVWTTDSNRVTYASRRKGSKGYDIYWSPIGESVEATLLVGGDGSQFPSSWSPRDEQLAFYELSNEKARDIKVWSVQGQKPVDVLTTTANERGAAFSPDGSLLAYLSDASGRDEVYVRPYPGPGPEEIVSSGGGTEPAWSTDGRLFYWNNDQLFAAAIRSTPRLTVGAPVPVLRGAYVRSPAETGQPNYSVFPDGKSFVMIRPLHNAAAHLHVVQNWFAQLTTAAR
jgi:serine/threonine-protein kinase